MPLLSLALWYGGIYLFTDRMITLGGYQAFADQLLQYTAAVLAMGIALLLWVAWNFFHYGRHDRRNVIPKQVTTPQVGETMHLDPRCVSALQESRAIALHFDESRLPVIERMSGGPPAACGTGKTDDPSSPDRVSLPSS